MSPPSISSSMGAEHGSAHDSYYVASARDSRSQPERQSVYHSAAGYNQRDRNSTTSQYTNTHENSSSAQQYTDAQYANTQNANTRYADTQSTSSHHYFQTYENEAPYYDNHLTFEEENHNIPTETATETPYYGEQTQQAPAQDQWYQDDHHDTTTTTDTSYYGEQAQHAPTQDQGYYTNQANGSHPPTTERWAAEMSPHERIRLGLSRYPSEEERRLAYENAVDYESRRSQ